jgi:hypothetical protein
VSTVGIVEVIIHYPSALTINEVLEFLLEVEMKFDYWTKKGFLIEI